ncbi:AraC family transcriptional regulator [Paenibacillus spongiae]|uniref:AraC family transcriptional regulator n=1 Tax=Paenibacillus spongiae TaxID=2909671 RepID=A0ABY5SD91_9BACL|nr:AraC family transcriptional regulator [Paenibacillus spongiae]UVI31927.1 AraC family transcriptional regulator [Paenibacillus spongiae]
MTRYPTNETSLTQETVPFPIVIHKSTMQQAVLPHHHQFYELSFYVEGSALDVVNGQLIRSSRGTVVCKLPHRIHETRIMEGRPYTKFSLMFDMDILLESGIEYALKRYFYNDPGSRHPAFIQLSDTESGLMERLFDELFDEYQSDRLFRQAYIRSKLVEILIGIARSQGGVRGLDARGVPVKPPVPVSTPNTAMQGNKITQVLQYINSHFLTDMSLGSLSEQFDASTPYLSKMIKKITGMTFTEYLHELRMEMACSLLISTRMSILDVSGESGYSSFKTFSRVFLRKKGMPPSKYRSKYADPGHDPGSVSS